MAERSDQPLQLPPLRRTLPSSLTYAGPSTPSYPATTPCHAPIPSPPPPRVFSSPISPSLATPSPPCSSSSSLTTRNFCVELDYSSRGG